MKKIFIKTISTCYECPNRFLIGGGEAKCEKTGKLVDKIIPNDCPLQYEKYTDEIEQHSSFKGIEMIELAPEPFNNLTDKTNQEIISLHAQAVTQYSCFPKSNNNWMKREHILYAELIRRMEDKYD